MKKRVLVTGSNGLLGQHLVSLLVKNEGFDVVATGRGEDRLQESGYKYYELDITDKAQVSQIFDIVQPDMVVHSAAMTQVDDCEQNPEKAELVNVTATSYLIDAARTNTAFFLYVSTDFVFGGDKGMLTEKDMPNPVNLYGHTKLRAEKLVQQSDLSYAIARTVLVYGQVKDMSRSNIVLWVKRNLEEGKPIRVVEDQWRTPTYVGDLAMGCMLLLQKQSEGVFHISGKDYLRPYDMALRAAELFGLDKSLISPTNASEFKEIGRRPLKTGFDISKASKELGYEPVSFQKGIELMMEGKFLSI